MDKQYNDLHSNRFDDIASWKLVIQCGARMCANMNQARQGTFVAINGSDLGATTGAILYGVLKTRNSTKI